MRRFVTVLAASTIALAVGGSVASAGTDDYPPGDDTVLLLSSSVVAPGEAFTATLTDCTAGETVDFTVGDDAASGICTNPEASATLTAPSVEGTYVVSGIGQVSGAAASAEIVVDGDDDGDDGVTDDDDGAAVGDDGAAAGDAGQLPATGSSSGTVAQIGAGLLVGGFGLVTVARLRRRRPVSA